MTYREAKLCILKVRIICLPTAANKEHVRIQDFVWDGALRMRVKNITSPTRNWVGRQRLRWGAKLLIAILKSIEIIKPSTNDA